MKAMAWDIIFFLPRIMASSLPAAFLTAHVPQPPGLSRPRQKKEPPCKQSGPSGWDIGKLPIFMIRHFACRVNRNLCHIWSNDKKILNFCESLPKMPVPTFQGPGIML